MPNNNSKATLGLWKQLWEYNPSLVAIHSYTFMNNAVQCMQQPESLKQGRGDLGSQYKGHSV